MKKIFTQLLILLGFLQISYSQTNFNYYFFNNAISGPAAPKQLRASKQTADGGLLVATEADFRGEISLTDYGINIIKYNNTGTRVWNKYIYGFSSYNINTNKILELADGSFILAVSTNYNAGSIIKISSTGDFIFHKGYGGFINDIIVDPLDNGFIIASGGGSAKFSAASLAGFIIKTDAAGNSIWSFKADYTLNNDYYYSAKRLSDGTILAVGQSVSTPSAIASGGLVAKYSAQGSLLWSKTYTNASGGYILSPFTNFIEMKDKTILIAGKETEYSMPSRPLVAKIDADGNSLWAKTFSSGNTKASISDTTVYFAGTLDLPASNSKYYISKVNKNGNLVEAHLLRPSQTDVAGFTVGLDYMYDFNVYGKNLNINSVYAVFTMDTSVVNSCLFSKDTILSSATTNFNVLPAIPLKTDADTSNYFIPLALKTSTNVDFVKNNACNFVVSTFIINPDSKMISVFPNPTSDIVTIKINDFTHAVLYTISDITGRKLLSGKLLDESSTIDLGTLANGIYLFQLEKSNQSFKIIKI